MTLPTALLLSASLLSPFKTLVHPGNTPSSDQRVRFTLLNTGHTFADLRIGNQTYTVLANQDLVIKAPLGTVVYAASRFDNYHRGDAVLTVSASLQESRVDLR